MANETNAKTAAAATEKALEEKASSKSTGKASAPRKREVKGFEVLSHIDYISATSKRATAASQGKIVNDLSERDADRFTLLGCVKPVI